MCNKCKQAFSPTKCKKVKNPCKFCFRTVTARNGIQCQGACRKWIHFKCLCYTPGKIQDIKKGYIQVICPCPDCDSPPSINEKQLIGVPYYCGKFSCPASAKPVCDIAACQKNNPIPGLSQHSCPEDCSSETCVKKCHLPCEKRDKACYLPCETRDKACGRKKLLQSCSFLSRDISLESSCSQGVVEILPKNRCESLKKECIEQKSLLKCCLDNDLSSECMFLEHIRSPEHKRAYVKEKSPHLRRPQKKERSPEHGNLSVQERSRQRKIFETDNSLSHPRKSSLEVSSEREKEKKPASSSKEFSGNKAKLKKTNKPPIDDQAACINPDTKVIGSPPATSSSLLIFSPGRKGRRIVSIDLIGSKTASLIRRILNSKEIQYPSIHKTVMHSAGLEFSQNMPSDMHRDCHVLPKKCSIEIVDAVTNPEHNNSIFKSSFMNELSSDIKAVRLCKSDSCLVLSHSDSRNTIFTAIGQTLRHYMGKMLNVFQPTS